MKKCFQRITEQTSESRSTTDFLTSLMTLWWNEEGSDWWDCTNTVNSSANRSLSNASVRKGTTRGQTDELFLEAFPSHNVVMSGFRVFLDASPVDFHSAGTTVWPQSEIQWRSDPSWRLFVRVVHQNRAVGNHRLHMFLIVAFLQSQAGWYSFTYRLWIVGIKIKLLLIYFGSVLGVITGF